MSTGCETWEATASRSADSAGARESEDLPNAPDTPYPAVSASWTGWTDRWFPHAEFGVFPDALDSFSPLGGDQWHWNTGEHL